MSNFFKTAKPWLLRYAVAMILTYLMICLMTFVQLQTENRVMKNEDDFSPLLDIAHESGLDLRHHRKIVDYILFPLYGLIFIYLVLFMYGKMKVIGLRIIWHVLIIYGLRTLALAFTTMKGPTADHCEHHIIPESIMAYKSFIGMFTGTFHCNDMMFSGHTSITVALSMMVLISYSGNIRFRILEIIFKILVFLMMSAELLLIVWTRRHYTMDVVIGVIVSLSVVAIYHGTLLSAILYRNMNGELSRSLKSLRVPLLFGSCPFVFTMIIWMDGVNVNDDEGKTKDLYPEKLVLGILPNETRNNLDSFA